MIHNAILRLQNPNFPIVLSSPKSALHELIPVGASEICYSCGRVLCEGKVISEGKEKGAVHYIMKPRHHNNTTYGYKRR